MNTGLFSLTHRYACLLLLLLTVFVMSTPGQAQLYDLGLDQPWVVQTPGSLTYQKSLGLEKRFFAEISGNVDEDDPLLDFSSYISDPVNWDPTTFIDRQFVYQGNVGYQQTGRMFNIPGTLSLGIQTRLDQALVGYRPPSPGERFSGPTPLNLLDGMYAPYVTLQTQPLPWIRVLGDVRLDVVSFDVQRVCRSTCSKEPNGGNNDVIPSLKGNIILGPWFGTEGFVNVGTGFYNPDDREPAGSIIEEKLSRTTAIEGGIRTQPWDGFKLSASLWSAELQSDLRFLEDGETIEDGGPSRRFGTNFGVQMNLSEKLTLFGNLSASRAEFRETGQSVSLAPNLTSQVGLTSEWESGWSTTVQANYIGPRPDEANVTTLSSLTTLDLIGRYTPSIPGAPENLEVTLGILNLTNETGPSTQFLFDSKLGADTTPVADVNYFPGQPRMFVGGISWSF